MEKIIENRRKNRRVRGRRKMQQRRRKWIR
jgi:hypothetical protein